MTAAVLRRWLKVSDPTALTTRETLQRALAYQRTVRDVGRSEVFGFLWDQDEMDPLGVLQRLCDRTNLLLNPNKHHSEIRGPEESLAPRGNVWVLVVRDGETEAAEQSVARHGGLTRPPRIRTGTLWELDLTGEDEERVRLAREIAVCRSRRQGLLANPHVEQAVVFATPPRAGEVLSALELR